MHSPSQGAGYREPAAPEPAPAKQPVLRAAMQAARQAIPSAEVVAANEALAKRRREVHARAREKDKQGREALLDWIGKLSVTYRDMVDEIADELDCLKAQADAEMQAGVSL
jgi:hypothetical protein